MGMHETLKNAGYTDTVQTDTIISWDSALKVTRHKAPITTKAQFHAKRGGKYFRVVVECHYNNRSSDLRFSSVLTEEEVTIGQYNAAVAEVNDITVHKRV